MSSATITRSESKAADARRIVFPVPASPPENKSTAETICKPKLETKKRDGKSPCKNCRVKTKPVKKNCKKRNKPMFKLGSWHGAFKGTLDF